MTASLLRVPARESREATVIFLHGLGQTNESWKGTIEWLSRQLPKIEWILPQASSKPVTLSRGQSRPSWFDITTLPPGEAEWDEVCISGSIAIIENIIQAEVHAGMDSRKIVLIGFSQGAATSLMVALTTLHELGGVASLSGWIPHRGREQIIHTDPTLPVFWGHGKADTEIPTYYSEEAVCFLRDVLRLPAQCLTIKRYDGLEHAINVAEMNDLLIWIFRVLEMKPVINGIVG